MPDDLTLRDRVSLLHAAACKREEDSYIDPSTGLLVMTAHALRARGFCCAVGCRHCPYSPEEQGDAGRPLDAPVWNEGLA
jgi:hypothetical protein